MKRFSLATVVGSALMLSGSAFAESPEILDLRGIRIEAPRLAPTHVTSQLASLASRTDARHLIVRLVEDLDRPGRDRIAEEGIQLLSCLGPRTWIASTSPAVAERAASFSDRIEWAGPLPREAKLHPFLAAGGVPEWTIDRRALEAFIEGRDADVERVVEQITESDDPIVALYVLAQGDIELGGFTALLEAGGVEIRSRMNTVNGLLVRSRMSMIDRILDLDETLWVEPALPPLSSNNASNRVNTQVDVVHQAPYGLDGDGVVVMVYDGGYADASHPDFGGRLTVRDSSGQSTHGTHVSGTVGGDGSNSGGTHKGMAPAVTIESYGFEQEGGLSEGFLYTDPGDIEADYSDAINNWGAVIANNSIGTNTAPNGYPCEWTGDYGVTSNLIDAVVRGDLGGDIRIVWANGNERQTTRCGDLFNTTAPPACAKNHITVGASNSDDDSITSFTSWGPADDGRIKPDISAPGCENGDDGGVTSTFPGGGYGAYCGTSMATPTVTGISALIVQEWRRLHPGEPDLSNAGLKALLANSGDDLGQPGPDCQYGFGTVRARQAIDSLRADGVIESAIGNGATGEHLVIVQPGESMLRITLAWDDEPASPLPAAALVNDLDLVVTSPTGQVFDPWTIDPSDPGAAATRSGPDRLNNMEQVSVSDPTPGAWRVQVVGHAVPVGPQTYAVSSTPNPISCSSTGVVGFAGQRVQPETIVGITAVDCDLNTDDRITNTVAVRIWSDDNLGGFDTVLTEDDPASSSFYGSIELTSNPTGFGLYVEDGSTFYVEYIDEMDASGNVDVSVIASAIVDGTIDGPDAVEAIEFGPDSATIRVSTSESVRVTVLYGSSCDGLDQEYTSSTFGTDQEITISGLQDNSTYYFRIVIEDMAGNSGTFGDGTDCFSFTVPDALDFYVEQFGGTIDLADSRIRFLPVDTADLYAPCFEEFTALPYDPAGGVSLGLGDDSFEQIDLPFSFPFYGSVYDVAFVGSNGYLTFESGDTAYNESIAAHFDRPRISMLFDDLNPSAGGSVSWRNFG
ncbi:MAG: S8 family serine peptidase, partial [Phycisphaera sp.]|nr:S8 family serine peptidase [Phycisphaera sp.]